MLSHYTQSLRGLSAPLRGFHSARVLRTNAFATPFLDTEAFTSTLHQTLQGPAPVAAEVALSALHNIRLLQDAAQEGDKFSETTAALVRELSAAAATIFEAETVTLDAALLKQYFLKVKPPVADTLCAIKTFYKRNPGAHVDRITAMIPFRQYLFRNETAACFDVIDATTNHKRYRRHLQKELHRKIGYTAGVGIVGLGLMDRFLRTIVPDDDPTLLTNFYTMFGAYVVNGVFMGSIALSSLMSKNKDNFLNWQTGVLQRHWFYHQDEMKMCSAIAEFDAEFNGADGFATKTVMDACMARQLEPAPNVEEFMLQEYWLRQGDGFEWVEPDQDPADILLVQHLQQYIPQKLGEKLKWVEQLTAGAEPEALEAPKLTGAENV